MDEIDKLLAGIGEPLPVRKSTPPIEPTKPLVTAAIDDLLAQQPSLTPPNPPPMDDLLTQVKAEQDEKAQAELLRQQEIEREQKQQERLKQQRLEQLKAQRRQESRQAAEQWLKKLKPKSEEGRWFEEFACNYESRLEAAIDYLEALEDVDDMLPRR
jgi:multidrug efflux pump subunit AcrA (membrane-fusion protein)